MLNQISMFPPDKQLPLRRRVTLEIISLADARYMLTQFHYLHRTRVGRQINYAVLIDGVVDGVITYAYPFTSSTIVGVPPGEVIEFARLYLHQNIPHSATCAIGKSLRRIVEDWRRKFPDAKRPRLIVSWSDTEYHKGTIYKAANFKLLYRTNGKISRHGADGTRANHNDYYHDKDCWGYWLEKQEATDAMADG